MQTAATASPEAMNRSAVLANLREEAARQEQDIADLERLQMTMSDYAKCLEACGVAADEESIMAASKDLLNYIETDWEREQREMMAEFQVKLSEFITTCRMCITNFILSQVGSGTYMHSWAPLTENLAGEKS